MDKSHSGNTRPAPVVAIINTNDDLVRILREELIKKG
jgi:hypothetical protein